MSITQTLSSQGRKPTGALGWIIAWTMPVMFRSLYAKVARLLNLQPGDDVLDVACGSGAFLKRHASQVNRITGLDHSEIQISLAKRCNRDRVAAGTAEFVQGDATVLPWPDNRFSAVTSNCVSCFAEPQRSLKEMQRVLRPGGRAVLVMGGTDKNRENRPREADKFGMPIWTEDEVRQMMADAGFSQISASYDKKAKMWFAEGRKQ
ncbi:MAG: class I SAM-dependent methyltransferase [Micromonosporaceae bacterium]